MPLDMSAPDHRTMLTCDYVLLNPLQVDAATWRDLPAAAVIPRGYEAQPELFPQLLALGKLDWSTRVGLLDRQQAWESEEDTPWFSALLFAPVSEERICNHLRRLMPLRLLDGEIGLLRCHDPRTSRHLAWLLGDAQRDRWLGPVTRWCWRNPDRTWQHVERRQVSTTALRFSKSQLATVERMGEINLVLAKLARVASNSDGDEHAAPKIDALLAEAWQVHHLERRKDRLLYAEQGMRYGLDIHRHESLVHCLQQTRDGEDTYTGACAGFDAATMQRMAHEIHIHKERP